MFSSDRIFDGNYGRTKVTIFIQISTVVFAVGGHWYANFCVISKGIMCVKILTTIDTTKLKLCRIDDSFNNLMRAKTKKKDAKRLGWGSITLNQRLIVCILSQPNNHNPNNKTTITVVGLRLSNR